MTQPQTSIYGLPYEKFRGDEPGRTLNSGSTGMSPILAEEVEDQVARLDSDIADVQDDINELQAVVQPTTGWTIYTPTIFNDGTATYQTITGRWRRIGFLTVHHIIYINVNGNGSGTTPIEIQAPIPINRATRQTAIASIEGAAGGGGSNRVGYVVAFVTGSNLDRWDRIRFPNGVDSHLDNMTGADLVSGMLITIQGTYQEEESV